MRLPSPSNVLLILFWAKFLLSSVFAQVPSNMNTRGIAYPSFRFTRYKFLTINTTDMATSLGYTQATWDLPGSNSIESVGYDGLGDATTVVNEMGFTPNQWDCFINHYAYYAWTQLESKGVLQYFLNLGWDSSLWFAAVDKSSYPPVYQKPWSQLTADQQSNATELCYFEGLWNGIGLMYWTSTPPTFPPTPAPSSTGVPSLPGTSPPAIPAEINQPNSNPSSSAAFSRTLMSSVAYPMTALILAANRF